VAAGIDYAVAQKADVINLSLGGLPLTAFESSGPFFDALSRAAASGAVVVVAAGNDSLPICEQPSVEGVVLCVGSVDRSGSRSFFSSGDSASIMAPGGSGMGGDSDVLSTYKGGGYETVAGTSQASPHVAGVAALLASRGVRGQTAVDRILATATPKSPSLLYGYGIVNARAAVAGLPAGGSGSGSGGSTGGGGPGSGSGTGGGSAGGDSGDAAVMRVARVHKIRTARKNGVRARCHATAAGKCTVTVKRGRTVIFRGSKKVAAGQTAMVSVKPTAAGRSLLARGRAFTAVARLTVPGAAAKSVRLKFKR
jgi:subtilisin family serine protease